MNSTQCASLWMNHSLNPDGSLGLCCANKEVVLDSEHRKKIRQRMVAGEQIQGCQVCYIEESLGKSSLRQQYNRQYLQNHKNTFDSDYENFTHYDLSMGNKCNQRCRMCSPDFSTGWFKDYHRLKNEYGINLIGGSFNSSGNRYVESVSITSYQHIDDIIHSMSNSVGGLIVKLKGGEPLYMIENKILLSKMIEKNLHTRTEQLAITTNGTQYDTEILDLIGKFKTRQFNISIDATGKLYEYIRGSNIEWQECVERWKKLITHATRVTINNTLMIYNAYDYNNLQNFVSSELGKFNLNNFILFGPSYLQIKLIPHHDRLDLANKQYINTNLYNFVSQPDDDVNFTNSKLQLVKDFWHYSDSLDKIRDEQLLDIVPQLQVLL